MTIEELELENLRQFQERELEEANEQIKWLQYRLELMTYKRNKADKKVAALTKENQNLWDELKTCIQEENK
mgnify:CR=1 FL=1